MSHGFVIAAVCLTLTASSAAAQPSPFAQSGIAQPTPFEGQTTITPSPTPRTGTAQETTPRPGQNVQSLESLGMRGFSVALVLGEMQGTASPDALPAGAKRAITDMRDFLPYKSYRMLDASWTLCCAGRHGGVTGRLQGIEGTEYSFDVSANAVGGSKMAVMFRLREIQASPEETVVHAVTRTERERELADLRRQAEALQTEQAELERKGLGDGHPQRQTLRARRETLQRRIQESEARQVQGRRPTSIRTGSRPVMDTTFSMDVGETVVIGTSRLKGDKALIVLLTAASRSASAREP